MPSLLLLPRALRRPELPQAESHVMRSNQVDGRTNFFFEAEQRWPGVWQSFAA